MKSFIYAIILCFLGFCIYSNNDSLSRTIQISFSKHNNDFLTKEFTSKTIKNIPFILNFRSTNFLKSYGGRFSPEQKSCVFLNDDSKFPGNFNNGFKSHVFAPVEMDLVETIIISTGVICLVPLIIDLTKDREPSTISIAGGAAFGVCFVAALTYRYTIKNRKKDID